MLQSKPQDARLRRTMDAFRRICSSERELAADGFDGFVVVRESLLALQPSDRTDGMLRRDDVTVHDHVVLALVPRLDARLNAETLLDLGSETRCPRFVPSGRAVLDEDVAHFFAGW